MERTMHEPKTGAEFFAQSLVGETIAELLSVPGGVVVKMESGLRALVRRAHRTDIGGEKIVGFEQQLPKSPRVITLNFESGSRAVIEI